MELTIIVPAFKAEKWFKLNASFWRKITKYANVIIIEDDEIGESKETVENFGGRYFCKPNGNWGSVINFVLENNIIETPYFAIVDSDDVINIEELHILLDSLNGDDLYITDVIKKSFIDGGEKRIDKSNFSINRTVPFVHSIWIKTDLVKDLPKMPENTFYSDDLFVTFIQSVKNLRWKYVKCSPYIHYVDMPGQSISQFKNPRKDFAKNFYQYLRFNEFIGDTENKILLRNSHETAIYDLCLLYSLTNLKEFKKRAWNCIGFHTKYLKVPKTLIKIYFVLSRFWFWKRRKKLENY